jgi:hypothetical protein
MARAAAATLGLLALHTSLPSAAAGGTGLADTYYVAGAATASGRYERLSVRCNSKPVYRQVGGGFALFDPAGRDTTWAIGEAAVATKCGNSAHSEYLSYTCTRPPGPPTTAPQVACLAPGYSHLAPLRVQSLATAMPRMARRAQASGCRPTPRAGTPRLRSASPPA